MKSRRKNCDVCGFLCNKKFQIFESKHWKVDICENQEYLGRSYVTLKRHCSNLSDVNNQEWLDFKQLIINLESAYKKAFNVTNFNWSCLMNDSYKRIPANPHVHWHLRPRYSHDVNFSGLVFIDPEFGHHYARSKERSLILPEKNLLEIIMEIKKFL